MKYTAKEVAVYNAVIEHSVNDDAAYMDDLVHATGMNKHQICGVISTMRAKGMLIQEIEKRDGIKYKPIRAWVPAVKAYMSFSCDWHSDEQTQSFKLEADVDYDHPVFDNK